MKSKKYKTKKYNVIISLLTISILAGIFIIKSCSEETDAVPHAVSKSLKDKNALLQEKEGFIKRITLTEENNFQGMFKFPKGTILTLAKGKLHFKLPEGFKLIAKLQPQNASDANMPLAYQTASLSSGSVNCKCEAGSGCNPFIQGDNSGCSSDGSCTRCVMTLSEIEENGKIPLKNAVMEDAAIVNVAKPSLGCLRKGSLSLYKSPKGFIFEDPEVQGEIKKIISIFNSPKDNELIKNTAIDEKLPEGFLYEPFALFSKYMVLLPINVDDAYAIKNLGFFDVLGYKLPFNCDGDKPSPYIPFIDGIEREDGFRMATSYRCSCQAGSGCKLNRVRVFGVVYCDAGGCTNCTLSDHEEWKNKSSDKK